MSRNARTALVDLLSTEIGPAVDTADPHMDDGWLTAHVALRAVEWVLDAAGFGPNQPAASQVWGRLGMHETVDAVAAAHRRYELASDNDDGLEWPMPVDSYVGVIETVLATDLAALPVGPELSAPGRFAAPNEPDLVRSIEATTEFNGRFELYSWLIQRRVGGALCRHDLPSEIDRFIAHWSFRRSHPNPWVEWDRDAAFSLMVGIQRTSLVWSGRPRWDPGVETARDRALQFLFCFAEDTRFFTNCDAHVLDSWTQERGCDLLNGARFRINPEAMFDTGIVLFSRHAAGLWWHSEGDPDTPLGMSP